MVSIFRATKAKVEIEMMVGVGVILRVNSEIKVWKIVNGKPLVSVGALEKILMNLLLAKLTNGGFQYKL